MTEKQTLVSDKQAVVRTEHAVLVSTGDKLAHVQSHINRISASPPTYKCTYTLPLFKKNP